MLQGSTHTDLVVLQERGWRGFTKFTPLNEKPSTGKMWSGERLTKIQTTTSPDHVWPEVCTQIGEAAQNREQQEWAKEEPKLDNARRLRGIYCVDPDDREYSEILKNARRKLEILMPCQRHPSIVKTGAKPKNGNEMEFKTLL